ncbi:glycerol kinase GlpK [Lignipirellula cremea]|uniref:Glycerol kinase n=1 Tax=Lignipirellula cremea TaxID=2528010 RepID=A0A518DUS5_9BACT|nr:glycerol kinase GlpK [Lignipirellula cremea]QDU95587.1 Glycerol kinase [Lignipirellula cremea]
MAEYVLALDQGTTSSRAIVFRRDGTIAGQSQQEFEQILPAPGVVEHDPEVIWSTQLAVAREAMANASLIAEDIAAVGVTNQRETTILWDKETGQPIGNALVWQSRVSAPICEQLKAEGCEDVVREKTGLLLDPYFSGTKVKHLLDLHPGLRERAGRGEVLFGTVDTWLIWKLTGGRRHVTDYSNASRTQLLNIHTLEWDDELLRIFDVPRAMLPELVPSSAVYGETDAALFGCCIPIAGDAGDQQAATFGQACFTQGSAKNTYGTGCFLLMNVGDQPVASQNNLITTVGWYVGGKATYCLEGSVFVAGAVVQWLRDGLGLIETAAEIEELSATVEDSGGVYFVPAFVGLGAPHWDPYARGAIFGLTRQTTAGHIARAALDSMAWQTCDLLDAMQKDSGVPLAELKVDGGAAVNNTLMQFQADVLNTIVKRPQVSETTALGAAYLAGLAVGFWEGLHDIEKNWALDAEFHPVVNMEHREEQLAQWRKAVGRSGSWV